MSVLFVDLVGYTARTESWDAEDVREMLSGYFDVARTVIGRYGGVVEKFIGDAVMAVWGAPQAQEDDAERAVRAALELVAAVEDFGQRRHLPDLRARAGVVTGQVASWNSPGEGLVAGDRVNTAARVQSVADPGTVLVDEATRVASQAAIAYAPAGEHMVKGKAEPLVLWQATRVVAGAGGSQRVDGLEADFVGRTRELALVKELFHACAEGGRARLVLVSGAAGVGKSRLGWELRKYIEGLVTTVRWHHGRCPPYGDGVAFWGLAEMVRQRFGIGEEDSQDVARSKLEQELSTWVTDPEEQQFVLPRLAQLVTATDAELSRGELFAGWRLFLERMASKDPVVLLVEDLQWADAGLLDFCDYLLEWSADHPIFMLALARPELAERRPGWLSDRRNATTIHLDPLPAEVIETLLDALVPGMPVEVRSRIGAQAEGVPLYAVETIRALVDRDVVIPKGGTYRLVGDIGQLEVPATLTSLLAARLDNLPPAERELVKGLAVLGSTFSRQAVAAVSDLTVADVDELLRSLVRKEVLAVRADPLSPERGQYVFTQTMLRSVAHDTLTKRERKIRHLAVAEHLRRTFPEDGEEIAEVLASHYQDAYYAAPNDGDADTIREKAVAALVRAGARAGGLGAPDMAEEAYRRAAALVTKDEERTRLTERAADMARQAGRYEEALALYEGVQSGYLEAGLSRDAARLAAPMGWCLTRLGRAQRAIEIMQGALSALGGEGDRNRTLAALHSQLGQSLLHLGDRGRALPHIEQAITMSTALDLPDILSRSVIYKGLYLAYEARVVEGVALLQAAADLAHKHGLSDIETQTLGDVDYVNFFYDLPGAGRATEAALLHARRLGNATAQAHHLGNLGWIHLQTGRWAQARAEIDQAIDMSANEQTRAMTRVVLVLLESYRGDNMEARRQLADMAPLVDSDNNESKWMLLLAEAVVAAMEEHFSRAIAIAAPMIREAVASQGMVSDALKVGWPLALESALCAGELAEADELLSLLADVPVGHVPPFLRSQLARYRARLAAARGEDKRVEDDFRQAVAILTDLQYPYWLAQTEADFGRWLLSEGRIDDAQPLLSDAERALQELGAQPELNRLPLDRGAPVAQT